MTFFLIGDHHAIHPVIEASPGIANWGIGGLPVWDVELQRKLDEILSGNFERIYFSCSHPLAGCEKYEEIATLSGEFISFEQAERGFLYKEKRRNFSPENIQVMIEKYFEYILLILSLDSRIRLFPLTVYWHELRRKSKLKMPPIYEKLISLRSFDVSSVAVLNDLFSFVDEFGYLHPNIVNKVISLL